MSIKNIKNGEWFLHSVDRWPCNSTYGAGITLYTHAISVMDYKFTYETMPCMMGHFDVLELDENVATIRPSKMTGPSMVVRLIGESNWDLFIKTVGEPWVNEYSNKLLDDDDYIDFVPIFYASPSDAKDGKGVKYSYTSLKDRPKPSVKDEVNNVGFITALTKIFWPKQTVKPKELSVKK